jgi:hypothetical protein
VAANVQETQEPAQKAARTGQASRADDPALVEFSELVAAAAAAASDVLDLM